MAISRVQNVSANANNVALSSTTAGDVIITFGYNGTNANAVALPGTYTNLSTTVGTLQAGRLCYKISGGGETVTGTMTNATQIVALVYRGLDGTTPVTTNGTNLLAGNSNVITFNTMTMTDPGVSWVAGFAGAKAATAGMNGNTSIDLISRTNVTTAAGLDSGAALSSYAVQTLTVTGSGRTYSISVELLAAAAASAIKTVNGLAKASVKTVDGLAIASVKTIEGLS